MHVTQVEPTFEEAFIAQLKDREGAEAASAPSAPPAAGPTAPAALKSEDDADDAVITVEQSCPPLRRFHGGRRSLPVGRGEIFGLLGPNGAGKSTTFKMLCGLLPPTDGKALVLGIDLRRAAPSARGRIGYMAQKFSLYGNLSVLQNLRFLPAPMA